MALLVVSGCGEQLAAQVDESQTADVENIKAAGDESDASDNASDEKKSDGETPPLKLPLEKPQNSADKAPKPPELVKQLDAAKPVTADAKTNALPQVADGVTADWIIVDKSDRALVLYNRGEEIARYRNIRFGDVPLGHKQFEGDEKTPEGVYKIDARNPGSRYHLSLRVSYPNAADKAFANGRGKSPGGDIFIHGQPNGYNGPAISRDWTDGCIAVSNAEIEQIWKLVPDGAMIKIQQ